MINSRLRLQNSYVKLPKIFYTRLSPVPVSKPEVVIFNHKLAEEIGLICCLQRTTKGRSSCRKPNPEGCTPFAQAYAGHQFGNFTMLGDGRAIILGEQISSSGKRFDIQYKGSEELLTQGVATAVRLSVPCWEYIISEAMHFLASQRPGVSLWY